MRIPFHVFIWKLLIQIVANGQPTTNKFTDEASILSFYNEMVSLFEEDKLDELNNGMAKQLENEAPTVQDWMEILSNLKDGNMQPDFVWKSSFKFVFNITGYTESPINPANVVLKAYGRAEENTIDLLMVSFRSNWKSKGSFNSTCLFTKFVFFKRSEKLVERIKLNQVFLFNRENGTSYNNYARQTICSKGSLESTSQEVTKTRANSFSVLKTLNGLTKGKGEESIDRNRSSIKDDSFHLNGMTDYSYSDIGANITVNFEGTFPLEGQGDYSMAFTTNSSTNSGIAQSKTVGHGYFDFTHIEQMSSLPEVFFGVF